jgi:hypothetical protein
MLLQVPMSCVGAPIDRHLTSAPQSDRLEETFHPTGAVSSLLHRLAQHLPDSRARVLD